jgi:SH3-like domain-containing protein
MTQASRLLLCAVTALFLFSSCGKRGPRVLEVAYVSAPQEKLRERLAVVSNRTAVVKNAERVEVLEKQRRFARVRTARGMEGWIEQRYLVSQQVYDSFQKMALDSHTMPVQANAATRNETNLHVEPGRDTDHLYLLASGEKLALLKRATAPKTAAPPVVPTPSKPAMPAASAAKASGVADTKKPPANLPAAAAPQPPPPVLEDWWLARDSQGHVGWVLSRMVDLDVPLDIAQYAEGQRFVALFVLSEVQDGDKKVPQYLAVMTEPHDGLPFDYNQVRVFTWGIKRHRYETAYRDHNLEGFLPVTVGHEDFGKEGMLPTFILRAKDAGGNITDRKYKLNSPIVRRVLAPGEEKEKPKPHVASKEKKTAGAKSKKKRK